MFDEIIRDVDRLRDDWTRRHPAGADPEAPHGAQIAALRPAEGADSSGTVHVAIDPDGLPVSIGVDRGWRRSVGSERFGDAVTEACENAAAAQLSARLTEPVSVPGPDVAAYESDHPPRILTRDLSRDLNAMIQDVISADVSVAIVTGTGSAALGKLSISLSPAGLESITAEPQWLAGQTDDELTEDLAAALAAARTALAAGSHGPSDLLRTSISVLGLEGMDNGPRG